MLRNNQKVGQKADSSLPWPFSLQDVKTPNLAKLSWQCWNMGCMMETLPPRCCCSHSLVTTHWWHFYLARKQNFQTSYVFHEHICKKNQRHLFSPGRTHQLRVHCSAIGHPIVGDFTYSSGADDSPYRMMLHAHLLHIPLEPQPLLVCAGDPFLPTVDPKWVPQRTLRTLSATVDALMERRAEEDRRIKEEEREMERKKREQGRKGSREERTEEETEQQTRQCQEWLSEWAGDWAQRVSVLKDSNVPDEWEKFQLNNICF